MEIINVGHSDNFIVKVEVTVVFLGTFDQHLMEK